MVGWHDQQHRICPVAHSFECSYGERRYCIFSTGFQNQRAALSDATHLLGDSKAVLFIAHNQWHQGVFRQAADTLQSGLEQRIGASQLQQLLGYFSRERGQSLEPEPPQSTRGWICMVFGWEWRKSVFKRGHHPSAIGWGRRRCKGFRHSGPRSTAAT